VEEIISSPTINRLVFHTMVFVLLAVYKNINLLQGTWFDALHFCRAFGMELATIETAEENKLVMDHMINVLGII
jgi:hypothetical protein